MPGSPLTLPNVITLARIAACPVIFFLALSPDTGLRSWAFVLFVVAAVSDIWDGYLARRYGLVTNMGKLLDPFADKLLLVASYVPIYMVSQRGGTLDSLPWWGAMPLWVMVVIFGREVFITLFRSFAARRGVVIAAGAAGKRKALFQAIFAGAALLWYPLRAFGAERGFDSAIWDAWFAFHGAVVAISLGIAVVLTVYSLIDYLWSYRTLVGIRD
ncbi:MAG: CDP-diacylglycerol--glycerol-3-phosphate 3-phosphatidyltransferase [Gemmatimonadota bacterium]|nr:CDP-diacylglycerol--glycerol-3-phosphate 3-phosphatidyltransferase [Gemmatimonadota bacterium]